MIDLFSIVKDTFGDYGYAILIYFTFLGYIPFIIKVYFRSLPQSKTRKEWISTPTEDRVLLSAFFGLFYLILAIAFLLIPSSFKTFGFNVRELEPNTRSLLITLVGISLGVFLPMRKNAALFNLGNLVRACYLFLALLFINALSYPQPPSKFIMSFIGLFISPLILLVLVYYGYSPPQVIKKYVELLCAIPTFKLKVYRKFIK
ncbi:Uncharacterised protein [uncultured archaeon]|nr:Uncharacterised protein [uncultured archaeon]